MDWKPIDTLPENTYALLWLEWPDKDGRQQTVDRYRWVERNEHEEMADEKTEGGYIKRTRVRKVCEREWENDGWGGTHWTALPSPPVRRG